MAITDEIIGISQLLGARALAAPLQVYAYADENGKPEDEPDKTATVSIHFRFFSQIRQQRKFG